MVQRLSKAPQTPLDHLRDLLAEQAGLEGQAGAGLASLVQTIGKPALRELGPCLLSSRVGKPLKKAIYALAARFDWPEWVGPIEAALQREGDLGLFDEGCAALGGLHIREAVEALRRLAELRREPDRQVILSRELASTVPQHGVAHYLGRLAEGQSNPRLAAQGSKVLVATAGPAELEGLMEVVRQGEELSTRYALRIIAGMPEPGAGQFLADLLEGLRVEYQDSLLLEGVLHRVSTMPRAGVRDGLVKLALERWGADHREACVQLSMEVDGEAEDRGHHAAIEELRATAQGVCDVFILEGLALLLESKVARYSAYQAETAEALETRLGQIAQQAGMVSELLAYRVVQGLSPREETAALLYACFSARVGQDALLQAYMTLVQPGDGEVLAALLAEPEPSRRSRCLNALGAREEDGFTPFFLKAMQDPIVEVGQLAMHHLGRLPGSFPALMAMFESGHLDQVRRAIQVFGENRVTEAAGPLLAFLQRESRDDLVVEAVDALGPIRYEPATPVFLELLHDGKPLNLQIGLARALGDMGTPEASLGLLEKAVHLKQAQVLILALEGALSAFTGFDCVMPLDHVPAFLALVARCCDEREGEGHRLRAILATENLYTFDAKAYDTLKDRFSDHLFDMRTKEAWDRESNDRVAAVIKELARRSGNLVQLARKEADIRARLERLAAVRSGRVEELQGIRDLLADSEMIIRPELAADLAKGVLAGLDPMPKEWRETAMLCEVAGLSTSQALVDVVRDIYQRASGLGLKSAARSALARLGLSPQDMDKRPPARSLLVLEPSAFFRKRLVGWLREHGTWTVREAGDRVEAEALLSAAPVDVLISEAQDASGDLAEWLEEVWERHLCRGVLLSASSRDAAERIAGAKVVGSLFKPYPMEVLADML